MTRHNEGYNSSGKSNRQEGLYANYFEVGHNEYEFVIDFGQFYGDENEARKHTRIIINPAYLKTLMELLVESDREYEESFGTGQRDVKREGG